MCLVRSICITDRSHIDLDHSKIAFIFQDGSDKKAGETPADETMQDDGGETASCLSGVSGLQDFQSLHQQY